MPQYKLTYFDLAALAEPIRWAFKLAEVDFVDERVILEEWPALKKSGRFPAEQLPLLEIDGEIFTQAHAILRYLGNKFGLNVDDEILKLRVDEALDVVTDARIAFRAYLLEQDPEKRGTIKEDLTKDTLPMFLKQLESVVSKTDGVYLTGSKLTVADLAIAHWTTVWNDYMETDLLQNFPTLNQLRKTIVALPQIDAWLKVRPVTKYMGVQL